MHSLTMPLGWHRTKQGLNWYRRAKTKDLNERKWKNVESK